MGHHHVAVEDLDPAPDRPSDQRSISDAARLDRLSVHHYELQPGEQVPLAYHVHDEQEEAFYVLSGTLAVETPDREYRVDADEAFVVHPESPQRAYNPESADAPVRALAVGAPAVDDVHPYEP